MKWPGRSESSSLTLLMGDRSSLSKIQKGVTWSDGLLALAVAGLAFFVYGRTVTPGLLPGDSGEFQTLPYLLGNTHPTGYPTYLLLARSFSFLPLGDLALRINLFSALMAALTLSGIYLSGRLLTGYPATAAAGTLALTLSPTLWSQATIAEVYTAGAAFFVFVLFFLLRWDLSNNKWSLFIAGLLGGLGLGVHMSVALLAPAVLVFLLLHWQRGWRMWVSAVSGALCGLLVTILLFVLIDRHDPIASYFNSVVEPSRSAWGYEFWQIDDPLEHLLFGWRGRQFQYLMFANVNEVMPGQAAAYWANLGQEIAPPLLLASAVGAIWMLLRRPRVAALLITGLILQLFYFFNYEIWDLYVFYIPSYVLLILLAIAGLGALIEISNWMLQILISKRSINSRWLDISLAILLMAFVVWPDFEPRRGGIVNGEAAFAFDEYPVYDPNLKFIATATVVNLPQDAIAFTDWNMMWPYYYTAHLENGRPDLMFIETFPADDQDRIADSLLEYVLQNLDSHPVFFEERIPQLATMEGINASPMRIGPSIMFKVTKS